MKEELRSLRSLQDGNENRGQLFALLSQRCELLRADNPGFHEQFQPVGAFFNLAQRIAAFRDELSFAPRAKRFSIISADCQKCAPTYFNVQLPRQKPSW